MMNALEKLVRSRAGNLCEYCRLPQKFSRLTFSVDHIIAQQHHGLTVEGNLALACPFCNRHKGPNIAGIDSQTGQMTRLFHPRMDMWKEHFQWTGPAAEGKTTIGRATIEVLAMNHLLQRAVRSTLIAEGVSLD